MRILLSSSGVNESVLQEGEDDSVQVIRVGSTELIPVAFKEARKLTEEFTRGLVAVISWHSYHLDEIKQRLTGCGWQTLPGHHQTLSREIVPGTSDPSHQVLLARPENVRGLEFDGVVVVEPAEFRPNREGHGALYTSLTRAHRKLVVVHSRALPQELRRRT